MILAGSYFLVAINACSKSGSSTQPPAGGSNTFKIEISNLKFPATVTVKKGTIVTWHNGDGFTHTVTSNDGTTFNSGNLAGNASFSYTANVAGTFAYHCNIHSPMTGTLVVDP